MALGLNIGGNGNGGGDFVGFIKYDSRAGRIFRRDRAQDSGGNWISNDADITNGFKAVFDLENIEVGWINYPAGAAPQLSLVKLGEQFPAKPAEGFKQGARILLKLSKESGGDVREISSNAAAFLRGIDALHTAYETQKGANSGKLPIVSLKTTQPIVSGQGQKKSTNYEPVFEIVGWASRPVDLTHGTKPAAPAAPPSTGSTPVSAPAPKAAPQPAMAEEDFG